MNEIVNKFLLVGDKFMPELHLKQPAFTYSACGPFTKNKMISEFLNSIHFTKIKYKRLGVNSTGQFKKFLLMESTNHLFFIYQS